MTAVRGPATIAAIVVFAVAPLGWDLCFALGRPALADVVMRSAFYAGLALLAALVAAGPAADDRPDPTRADSRAPSAARRSRGLDLLGGAALGFLVELVGVRSMVLSDAVPVLRHDWSWPPGRAELGALAANATGWWVPSGLGSAKAFPTLYTLDVPLGWVARVADSHAVLFLALLSFATVAGLGLVALLHRGFGLSLGATFPAIVAYVGSPFALDELVAGHLLNLAGFAALPLVAAVVVALAAPSSQSRTRLAELGLAFGALVAFSAAQIQYVVFDALAAVIAAVVLRVPSSRVLPVLAVGFTIVAAAHGLSLVHLAMPGDHGGFTAASSPREWFFTLSQATPQILAQSGYIGGYADAARLFPERIETPLMTTTAWVVLGYAAVRGGRPGRVAAALAICGVIGATGVYGPFAALKLAASALRPMTALREAYNLQALTTLGLATAIAVVFDRALRTGTPRRVLAFAAGAAALALAAVGSYGFASGAAGSELHGATEGRDQARLRAILGADRSDARVVLLPLIEPIRQDGYAYGGTEPYAAGLAGHPVLTEFEPDPAVATAALLLDRPDPEPGLTLLGRLGVKFVVLRNDMVSDLPQYWFPALFPPDWSTRDAYPRLRAARDLRLRYRGDALDLYELNSYRPRISLASAGPPCVSGSLAALAEACPPGDGTAIAAEASGKHVALASDPDGFDPDSHWIASTKLFTLGLAFAREAGDIATTGAAFSIQHLATAAGTPLRLGCVARHAPLVSLGGGPFAVARCARDLDAPFVWTSLAAATPGETLVIAGRGGPAVVSVRAAVPPSRSAGSGAIGFVRPIDSGEPGATLTYDHARPDVVDGRYARGRAGLLLFSDAFDDRWRLQLDGAAPLGSLRANEGENAFEVPAGSHRFTLRFEPSVSDRALDGVQGAVWYALPILWLVVRGLSRRVSVGGRARVAKAHGAA